MYTNYSNELYHYGVLGMKWGVRRYQNTDGSLTDAGKKRYAKKEADVQRMVNSISGDIDYYKDLAEEYGNYPDEVADINSEISALKENQKKWQNILDVGVTNYYSVEDLVADDIATASGYAALYGSLAVSGLTVVGLAKLVSKVLL